MNKFLEMKERGEEIPFSILLDDIPPDHILIKLFPNAYNPRRLLVSHSGLEVLNLRLKGFTQAEIAEQLGLTSSQVAYRSKEIKNALHMNVPPYIHVDIPALGRLLTVPWELTGYTLLSELLEDMPSDEELKRLFLERVNIRGGKRGAAPTNRDLQLLKMRAEKQSYISIGEAMGMEAKEVQHQISLILKRIRRDLQIKLDVPGLYRSRLPS